MLVRHRHIEKFEVFDSIKLHDLQISLIRSS